MVRFALDEDFPEQVWRLSAHSKNHDDPWKELLKVADHLKLSVHDLFQASRLSKEELQRKPLDETELSF